MKNELKEIWITKASGEKNIFSPDKLRNSLMRSGASKEVVDGVFEQIFPSLYNGISTAEIYRIAFRLLKKYKKGPAAKYKLKYAIMELGPSGFPFEQFIERIFQSMGFTTQIGKLIDGKCVTHEVDVIAVKDREKNLIECKFHQQKGNYCDVKVPLYISARFNDIEQHHSKAAGDGISSFKGWVATNTHFTKDAITYGLCTGLNLLGWDFPAGKSLRELIDKYGLHPLTCLTTLTKQEKQRLLEKDIVLCSELSNHETLLKSIVHEERVEKVKAECVFLSNKKETLSTNTIF